MNYKYCLLVRHAIYQCFIEDCIIYRQLLTKYLYDSDLGKCLTGPVKVYMNHALKFDT